MQDVIKVENLSKSFGAVKAVQNLSFTVKKGALFAFLGQNGAGKSTTINMLIGALGSDGGSIEYGDGISFKQFKDKIGVVYQNNICDDDLTVEENIKLYCDLYIADRQESKRRYASLAEMFDLGECGKKKFKTLSGGQKRRAEVARALVNSPEILFLDEPTTGLDPKTRIDVWRIINEIRRQTGMTVFLTTHYMEETADADEVVIIHNGQKIAEGSPAELKEKYSCDRVKIVPINEEDFIKSVQGTQYRKTADYYEFTFKDAADEIEFINSVKSHIKFFEVARGSMDDVFLNAVGQGISEA